MHYGPQSDGDTRTGPGLGGPVEPAPRRRPRWPYLVAAAAVLLAAGGTAGWFLARSTGPGKFNVTGQLEMADTSGTLPGALCAPSGAGYSDIHPGAQITVTDEAGRVLGLGQLEPGRAVPGGACVLPFTVRDVPADRPFYGVEIVHRGIVRYPAATVASGKVRVTLGG